MFGLIKWVIKTVALIGVVGVALTMYSAYQTSNAVLGSNVMGGENPQIVQQAQSSDNQMEVLKYGRKAMATVMSVAKPVLAEFGVDVGTYTEDSDEITRHLESATNALSDATNTLTGNP